MRWIERFDLFLLDFDGLLVDTERLHYEAYKELCRQYDYELPWEFHEYLGIAHSSAEGLRQSLHPHLIHKEKNWNILYSQKVKIYLNLLQSGNLQLMSGVETLLQELSMSRIKRCVVTNSSKQQVEIIKESLPILKTIPAWITREDYQDPKPAPDAYIKAIELLGDSEDKIIGFEDSVRGIQALKGTRVLPILICHPSHPQLEDPSLRGIDYFHSFESIPRSFHKALLTNHN